MKKVVLFLLLIYAVVVLFASYLTLSSHLSVTNKVTTLILCSFVYSSVVLLAIRAWLDACCTTKTLGGSNRLKTLAEKEREILRIAGKVTKSRTTDSEWLDEWENLNEQDLANRERASKKKKCNGAYCWCASDDNYH